MNVFIIGASGYIGRAVTAHVLEDSHSVTALIRSEASAAWLPTGDVRRTCTPMVNPSGSNVG